MEYKLESKFRSLEPFEKELPDFVILTGVNGVGKTQILQALIQTGNESAKIKINGLLIPSHEIRYIEPKLLAPNDLHVVGREYYDNSNDMEFLHEYFPIYSLILAYKNKFNELPTTFEDFKTYIEQSSGHIFPNLKLYRELISFIEEDPDNRPSEFEFLKTNFHKSYHPQISDLFTHNFSLIFKSYQSREERNFFNEYLSKQKGKNIPYLSNEDFIKKHGNPPWENINRILNEAKMDYKFEVPDAYDSEASYEPKFVKISNNISVKIPDLSSGEKILLSLFFALYNKEHASTLPKVLLLDETDASLHPLMSQQYLKILKNVFVEELGIKVLITTHSPSTVALAEEQDIFVVENTSERIRKCSKDEALSVLTAGVPSLSINYENRKQVFVESPFDVKYYDAIYKILSPHLDKEVSLNFISSGDSRTDKNGDPVANCSQVKHITQTMRRYGNKSCFGIIDWDLNNKETEEGIIVNALNNQYSIENCLLNPLFIGLLILITKNGPYNEVNYTFRDLDSSCPDTLNNIHDWILNKISSQFTTADNNLTSIELNNGLIIKTPQWFTHHQGHELETKILQVIPELNSLKRGKEEALKLEIINRVYEDCPELIPVNFRETFQRIQNS